MYSYIPHPTNARVSSAVMEMLAEEGACGYGIYWMLLEVLRDAPSYSIPYKPKSLAYSLHLVDVAQLERICNSYGLFELDTLGNLSCPWLSSQMEDYDEKKKKLQEAGRRGAQARWQHGEKVTSEPIATLSSKDSEPIAYNTTQYNVTKQDITLPSRGEDRKVTTSYLERKCAEDDKEHNAGYVAQVCLYYGMLESTCEILIEKTGGACLTNASYKRFCALVKRIQGEKWRPDHPDGFFLKKALEID